MMAQFSPFVRKLSALLVVTLFAVSNVLAQVEPPSLPQLGLVLQEPAYGEYQQNMQFRYPGLRIWYPIAPLGKEDHYLIVPVYVRNPWLSNNLASAEPIKSFQFSIRYDKRALRAVGVQMIGTRGSDTFAIAKQFQIQWDDRPDPLYKTRIPGNAGDPNGRRIRIVGTSSEPLSPTNFTNPTPGERGQFDWAILLFVKFKVMIQDDGTNTISDVTASNTPLIIAADTIRWNERDPWQYPFPTTGPDAVPNQPQPEPFGGLTNENLLTFNTEPTLKGMAYVRLTRIPQLGFKPDIGPSAVVREVPGTDKALWELIDPLTIDSASQDPQVVTRELDVVNIIDQSRITDLFVQSDQPWLLFQTVGQKNPIPQPSREGYVDYIDEGILGDINDPLGNPTQSDPTLRLRIICDPSRATGPAGVYVGYITFHSPTMLVSPVRLRVTFIIWRNPIEPNEEILVEEQDVTGRGIRITLESAQGQQQTLIFGTGASASDGVDPLFGEVAETDPLVPFEARWYPPETDIRMGDLTGRSLSRDIRDAHADTTIIYLCRFKAEQSDYPIVISWDISDFPPNARLFLRDTLNGSIFGVDMRNATHVGGTIYSFTIRDARITSFIIEYATPRVERFTFLQKGWNLVSLPVRPADPFWKTVFPNALDKPRYFFEGAYYQEDNLQVGRGYFVKYGSLLDSIIAGARVTSVGRETQYKVRLGKGWNTIGGLSVPVNVDNIQFDPLTDVSPIPTRVSGVYWYRTDEGYKEVSVMEPGKGYWVKTDEEGYLRLDAMKAAGVVRDRKQDVLRSSDVVVIRDQAHHVGRLYLSRESGISKWFELPPVPPAGLFDVRFGSGSYVESAANSPVVQFQGVQYPVVVAIENPSQSYKVVNPVTGEVLGTIDKGSSEAVVITDPRVKSVQLMSIGVVSGEGIALYPTPAQQYVFVEITAREDQPAQVELITVLGKKIASYRYDVHSGTQTVKLNVANLPEGVYVCRVSLGDKQFTQRLVIAR